MNRRSFITLCSVFVLLSVFLAGPAAAQGTYHVTILVVDDFTGADLPSADQFDTADSCTVSLESQAYVVRGVSADPIDEPHGELVYSELETLIADAGASSFIDLVRVDIQGVTTDVAADRISSAINSSSADYYVANMSFAIIPCEYITAFADFGSQLMDARDAKDLNRYRGLFKRAVIFYDNTVFPAMSQKAQQAQDLDPLQTLFANLSGSVVPVASAGNFGLDFPFWPGAWAQVVSVSASEGEGYYAPSSWDKKKDTPLLDAEVDQPGKKSRVSNYGEVMMPGEYGTLSGTSFAAPRLSVVMALYISDVGAGYCQNSNGGPALAYGDWDNLTLEEAVGQYCPGIQAFLP